MAKLSKKAARILDERLNRHRRKVVHTVTVLWHSGNQRYASYVKVKGKKKHIAGGTNLEAVEGVARAYAEEHGHKFRPYQGRRPEPSSGDLGAASVGPRPGDIGPGAATRDPAPPRPGAEVARQPVVAVADPDNLIIRRG